jgi:hypothetical protein
MDSENCFEMLDAPVVRCASLDTPVPFAIELEQNFLAKGRLDESGAEADEEQHKMDPQCETLKADKKMLAPAFEVDDLLTEHAFFFNFCIARYFKNFLAPELLDLLFENDYGWTFRHCCVFLICVLL